MAPSGKNKKESARTTGSARAIKTGEFKAAKTSPIVKASDEELETKGALKAPDASDAAALMDERVAAVTSKADAAAAAATAGVPASEAETVVPPPAAAKVPSGKNKLAPSSAKVAAIKTTSGKRPAVSATPTASARVSTGNEIWITCRECFEEWTIDPARARGQETISCPICEHRAQAPTDDVLHQIALYKGIEKKNLTLALGSFIVGVVAMLLWTLLTLNPNRAQEFVVFTLPLIVAGLSLLATLAFMAKYEGSRWETYF